VDQETGERMRGAFRRYPTGVAIIAALGPAGPVGLTASSVASVSLTPPALSFSVRHTPSARAILDAPSFVVHLLGPRHLDLAQDFARTGGPRFTPEQGWTRLPSGEPFLPGALAALRGTPLHRLPVGDATLVVATVTDVMAGPDDGPLIYHSRGFTALPAPAEEI
jgi:flavin reductase (DIM6/NTAB) family NADH-FMN oxidoreductase RutF